MTDEVSKISPVLIAFGAHLSRLETEHGIGPMTDREFDYYNKLEGKKSGLITTLHHQAAHLHGSGFFDSLWDGIKSVASDVIVPVAAAAANTAAPGTGDIVKTAANVVGLGERVSPKVKRGRKKQAKGSAFNVGGEYDVGGAFNVGGEYHVGGSSAASDLRQYAPGGFVDKETEASLSNEYQRFKIGEQYNINGTVFEMTDTGLIPSTSELTKRKKKAAVGGSYIDPDGTYIKPKQQGLLGSQRYMKLGDLVQ